MAEAARPLRASTLPLTCRRLPKHCSTAATAPATFTRFSEVIFCGCSKRWSASARECIRRSFLLTRNCAPAVVQFKIQIDHTQGAIHAQAFDSHVNHFSVFTGF